MTHRLSAAALLVVLLLPSTALAQNANTAEPCLADAYRLLGKEQRLYRSTIVGQRSAQDAPVSAVRFDKEGNAWTKTGVGQWRTVGTGFSGTTWGDSQMEQQAEFPARRGYLEIRRALTSELLPPMLQSVRALRCNLRSVCEAVSKSHPKNAPAVIPITVKGCIAVQIPKLAACQFEDESTRSDESEATSSCVKTAEALFEREMDLLKMLVAYDAASRTLRQFAGLVEEFLKDFRFPLLTPIWQAVRAVKEIGRMPCFAAQCDE